MMKIFGMAQSFNTTKVLYTAEELGVKYEYQEMDLSKGENKTPEFMARHPLGKTPVIEVNGKNLFESGAICRYLAASTDMGLYGRDEWERAQTDQWMDFFSIHPGRWIGTYAFEKVLRKQFNMGEPNLEAIKEAEGFLHQHLSMVNTQLSSNRHLAGDAFTIADIFAFAYMESAERSGFPIGEYQSLKTWFAGFIERPCVTNVKKKLKI